MRVLELEVRTFGDLIEFIQRSQQMRASEKLGVAGGDLGLGARMYCQRPVVLHAERSYFFQLLDIREEPGVIHHAQRYACCALFEVSLKEIEHLLLLRRSQFAGFASGYAGSCRAVACEFRHVTGHVSVCSLCPIVERGIFPGRVIKVEEPRSDFIQMGSAVRKAYCRNAAVTGDESRHTLSYEGLKILFGVIFNGKPVVVGMPVYKARRYRLACHVNNSICRGRVDIGPDGNYAVILI